MEFHETASAVKTLILEEMADASDFRFSLQQYESLLNVVVNQQSQVLSHAFAVASSSPGSNFCDTPKPVVFKVEGRDENFKRHKKKVLDRRIFRSRSSKTIPRQLTEDVAGTDVSDIPPTNKKVKVDESKSHLGGQASIPSNEEQQAETAESWTNDLQQNFILLQDAPSMHSNGSAASADIPSFLIPISADFFNSTGIDQQFVQIENNAGNPEGTVLIQNNGGGSTESASNPHLIHLTQNQILALLGNQESSNGTDIRRIVFSNNEGEGTSDRSFGNDAPPSDA